LKAFLLSLCFATVAIIGGFLLISNQLRFDQLPTYRWESLILLNFTTAVVFFYLIRSDRGLFVQLYLLTLVIKLFAYAGFNLVIILNPNAAANVAFFFVVYLIFTTLELIFLYRKVSN
jgi:hypothetical protein